MGETMTYIREKEFDAQKTCDALITWIQQYFEQNASSNTKAVIGISGGKDSSVVTALCVKALGKERVVGVLMPQNTQDDIQVSYDLVHHLDIKYHEINVGPAIAALYQEIDSKNLVRNSVATFNTPARIRMTTLYAICAIENGRVANTCNLSEDYVGYATKFGDGAGDFSPLSHLTVNEVKAIGRILNLPSKFVDKTPIDGLCGKTDEDNLGFTYDTLDIYIRTGVCHDPVIKAKIDTMYQKNVHKVTSMPVFDHIVF